VEGHDDSLDFAAWISETSNSKISSEFSPRSRVTIVRSLRKTTTGNYYCPNLLDRGISVSVRWIIRNKRKFHLEHRFSLSLSLYARGSMNSEKSMKYRCLLNLLTLYLIKENNDQFYSKYFLHAIRTGEPYSLNIQSLLHINERYHIKLPIFVG